MPGLKPGFFVVVLGACEDGVPSAFDALDAIHPQVYTREVEWKGPLGCPAFDEEWTPKSPLRLKHDKVELEILPFQFSHTNEGGDWETRTWLTHLRVHKGDSVIESKDLASDGNFATLLTINATAQAVTLTEEYAEPSCYETCRGAAEVYTRTWTIKLVKDRLDLKSRRAKVKSFPCSCGE